MQKDSGKKMAGYIVINILFILLFIVLELIGIFAYTDGSETRLAFRVIGRGVLGVLLVFNSSFMLITRKTTFLNSKVSPKQRLLSSVLLGIVGLGMIITALMGYGINGDPILKWWE
jgi:formate-dependent nitrite reductase membrane component NrfD